jgi:macrolide transport system ATP-binding/permease protein
MGLRTLRAFLVRLGGFLRRRDEFDEELASHLAMHVDDNVRAGMSPEAARRAALLKLGGVAQTRERYRDRRGLPGLDQVAQDVRFAVRSLRKSPGFAIIVILVPRFRRLAGAERQLRADGGVHHARDDAVRRRAGRIRGVGAGDAGFFETLRVAPALGRTFQPGEERTDGHIAILSDAAWHKYFGGRPDIIGQTLTLNEIAHTIVGVMPPGFSFRDSDPELVYTVPTSIW